MPNSEANRKNQEQALLFQFSADAIIGTTVDGVVTSWNRAAEKQLGFLESEAIGRHIGFCIPDDRKDEAPRISKQLAQGLGVSNMETKRTTKDGRLLEVSLTVSPVFGLQKKVIGGVGIMRDITEQKEAERNLKTSEERYRLLFENNTAAMAISDIDTTILMVNKELCKMTGYSRKELMGKSWADLIPPEDLPRLKEYNQLRSTKSKKVPKKYEFRFYCKEGSIKHAQMSIALIEGGAKVQVSLQDTTDLKNMESEIVRERDMAQAYLDVVGTIVVAIDKSGRVKKINKYGANLLGYSVEEVIGKNWFDSFIPVVERNRVKKVFGEIMQGKKVGLDSYENQVLAKDGGKRLIAWRNAYIPGDDGTIAQTLSSGTDITKRKIVEGHLLESYKRQKETMFGLISTLAMTIEVRDPYTAEHQKRVTELAVAIAKDIGLDDGDITGLKMAAAIHDLGKIYVPAEILNKPGKVTPMEYALIKTHPAAGCNIVKDINFEHPISEIITQHHERIDGSGYPKGLKGKHIHMRAKILGVADVVEAMCSHRPYRPALGIDAALDEITKNSGILYDEVITASCAKLFRKKQFSFK